MRFNIREDGIYYAGFVGIEENAAGLFRQFRLLTQKNDAADIVDFLEEAEYSDDLRDENVWDFYISKTGILALRFINIVGYDGRSGLSIVCFQNNAAVPLSDYQIPIIYHKVENENANQALLSIAQLDELYIDLGNAIYDNPERAERLFGWGSIGVYDSEQQLIALPIDRMFSNYGAFMSSSFPSWFCRVDEESMIFAFVHGMERCDQKTYSISDVINIASPESIYNQLDCGDSILVFTQQLRKNELWDSIAVNTLKLNRALGESLYRANPETGDKKLILTLARNNSFLYADANTAVTGGGKTISIYDIATDTPVLLKTIELEHKIVDRANKVDTAGGWLFLYGFNEKTQRDELLEKVYIGS